LDNETYMECLP